MPSEFQAPAYRAVPQRDRPQQPLYLQIVEQIRQQIATGALAPGDQLPTVRGLAEESGYSPSTVARAYAELRREGLAVGQRGSGTRVASHPGVTDGDPLRQARLINLVERALLEALGAGYTSGEVEAAFGLALARWREMHHVQPTPSPGVAPSEGRLRFVGSHDLAVELLAGQMRRRYPDIALSLEFTGSLGGLMALARGEADAAGTHLREPGTDQYNVDYVRHIMPGREVVLVSLATRQMGLMVAPGNPRSIQGLEDLRRPDVTLVNRQMGSGTRVLLDARLRQLGIPLTQVTGYGHVASTHLGVAEAVRSGQADVGLGILAAARAVGLTFLPLEHERYDLVIPQEQWERRPVQALMEILRDEDFKNTVATLGGYDVSAMGQIVKVGDSIP